MKKYSFGKRFRYWFDNQMSKGSGIMVLMLAAAALLVVAVIALIIGIGGLSEDAGAFGTFWDVLSTTINAWMPASEDGSVGYILLMALSAIIGLFFTSFLIGIISTAVEDKLSGLRKGNSVILETGHTVVLGFEEGEYELLRQIVLSAGDKPTCIVVADDKEKDEMEEQIHSNIDIPKNVRVICRHANPESPVSLACCSIPDAELVIVSPLDNQKTIKTLLSVNKVLENTESSVRIAATVSRYEYQLPRSFRDKNHIRVLQTGEAVARILAHCCTQPGLSEVFKEVFDFNGCEFHLTGGKEIEGLTFGELTLSADHAVPIGILSKGRMLLNPEADRKLSKGDEVLIFAEEADSMKLSATKKASPGTENPRKKAEKKEQLTIIGYNRFLKIAAGEFPESVKEILLAGMEEEEFAQAAEELSCREFSVAASEGDLNIPAVLEELAQKSDHILILCDHEEEENETDLKTTLLLLRLREIREQQGLSFTITAEMRCEDNCELAGGEEETDFIVSTNMSAMVLAQIAKEPALYEVFHELLSNGGNEFFMKPASDFGLQGTYSVGEIRESLLGSRYLFLGCLETEEGFDLRLNPGLSDTLTLGEQSRFVVIGEED